MTDDIRAPLINTETQEQSETALHKTNNKEASASSEETSGVVPTLNTPPPVQGSRSCGGAGRFWKSTTFRMILVGVVILLMLIPLSMVSSVVEERQSAYNEVLLDISSHWGKEQVLTGPILVLPYTETYYVTEKITDDKGRVIDVPKQYAEDLQAVLLPKKIHLEGTMKPEYRLRGLYQSLVYAEHLTLTGTFKNLETTVKSLIKEGREARIHWDKAFVAVGLSDPKGITRIAPLQFNDQHVDFSPGTRMTTLVESGFHAPLPFLTPMEDARFALEMDIKGSTGFRMAPIGELSEMHLSSTWAHPSFYGEILPSNRTVSDKGFDATWSIPHLVRSYPQYWINGKDAIVGIVNFSVGVSLFEPVTIYTEATRAVKYGILFIALTFLTLALLELITKSRPSMVQYVLIGTAMTVFYLLLIALAEHIGFNKAYAVASGTVIGLNSLYCLFVLSRKALALVITTVLSALYAVLFMTLRAEDYALLAGSILLVVAVAVTMFFTRNLHKINND